MHISLRSFFDSHLDHLSIIDVMHRVYVVQLLKFEIVLVIVVAVEIRLVVPFTNSLGSVSSMEINLVSRLLNLVLVCRKQTGRIDITSGGQMTKLVDLLLFLFHSVVKTKHTKISVEPRGRISLRRHFLRAFLLISHADEPLVLSRRFGSVLLIHLIAILINRLLFNRCRTVGVDPDWAAITHDLFRIQTIFSTLCIFHIIGSLYETSMRPVRLQRLSTLRSQIVPFSFSNGISLRVQMHQVGLNFLLSLLKFILAIKRIEIHSITIILDIVDREGTTLLLSVYDAFHASIVARFKQLALLVIHETSRILSPCLRFSV